MKGTSAGKTKYTKWGKMGHEMRVGNSKGGGQGSKVAPDGSKKSVVK